MPEPPALSLQRHDKHVQGLQNKPLANPHSWDLRQEAIIVQKNPSSRLTKHASIHSYHREYS